MSAVEKILHDGLQKDPADWSVRIELASKMAERGAHDEAANLLSEAPEAAPSEEILKRAAILAGEENPAATGLFESFVLENPSSAFAHLSLARIQAAKGKTNRARKHYETAIALDASLKDESLKIRLDPPAEPEPEPKAEPAAKVTAEPEPVAVPSPKPLRPPGREEKTKAEKEEDIPIIAVPVPMSPPGGEPEKDTGEAEPVVVAAAADLDEGEAIAVAIADEDEEAPSDQDADEFGESEEEEGERAFIVGEGELVHAHEKESDTKAKISALTMALLAHVGLLLLLGFIVISMPRPNPPQLVASSIASTEDNMIEEKVIERIQRNPNTASAQMNVVTTVAASPVSMPEFDISATTFDALGNTSDFGMSMAFEMSEDGAMVSFFGSKSMSKKVIFVVDYSASMKSGGKDRLMRKELSKSLEALPNGVEYALIMFSGPVWYSGQEVGKAKMHGKWRANEVRDGGKRFLWYEGWDEKSRNTNSGKNNALSHYEEGFDKLPEGKYIKATRSTIRKTVKQVQETPLVFGTDWRSPLMMAMNMMPDTIYFMTDGSLPSPPKGIKKSEVMKDLLAYNRKKSRAKINTICMMVLQARDELEALAKGSRGEFTLVLEDGTPVRGKDLDKVPPPKTKGKNKGKAKGKK